MQPPLMPRMSPAKERRDHLAKVKREAISQQHLRACVASIDAIDSGAITTEGPGMTARQVQQQFHPYEDRVIAQGIVREVLAQVQVLPNSSHRIVQQWQVAVLARAADVEEKLHTEAGFDSGPA